MKATRRNSTLGEPGSGRVGPHRREDPITEDNVHDFEPTLPPPKPYVPRNWRRPEDTLNGYTGHFEQEAPTHVLEEPLKKFVIRGYQGFIPLSRQVCGSASVPTQKQQLDREKERSKRSGYRSPRGAEEEPESDMTFFPDTARHTSTAAQSTAFREYVRTMDVAERYEHAVEKILSRGQTQEMLLRMVKAKISERVKSYSEQRVGLRKLFEAFDFNGDGVLDEMEFRECLERCNIQFDDAQVLALFAYFDGQYEGHIKWENFAEHASVMNPKGGTAVLPKQITATFKSCDWDRIGVSQVGR